MGNFLNIVSGTHSQKAINLAERFEQDNGSFILTNTGTTRFDSNMVNGINVGGRLSINTNDVNKLASTAHISYDQALKQIAVHELGHYNYAAQDAHNLAFTPEQKEIWCYQREGEATYFSFLVAQEARAAGFFMEVAGVTTKPQLYFDMVASSYSSLLTPESNAYSNYMINIGSTIFSADPQYRAYCTNYSQSNSTLSPQFVPPEQLSNYGGGGGGGGGGGYSPTPDLPENELFRGKMLSAEKQYYDSELFFIRQLIPITNASDVSMPAELILNSESTQLIGQRPYEIHYSMI